MQEGCRKSVKERYTGTLRSNHQNDYPTDLLLYFRSEWIRINIKETLPPLVTMAVEFAELSYQSPYT